MCEIYSKILGTGEFVYFSREGIHSLHPILMGSIAWEKETAAGLEAKIVLVLRWPTVPVCWWWREESQGGGGDSWDVDHQY